MGTVSNNRGSALVIEQAEEGLEFTVEHEDGSSAGVVFNEPQQMMDVFHEFVTVLREMGADIDLKFREAHE